MNKQVHEWLIVRQTIHLLHTEERGTDTHFWNSHSLLSSGHTCLVFSQRDIQWKWKACWGKESRFSMHENLGHVISKLQCTLDKGTSKESLKNKPQFYWVVEYSYSSGIHFHPSWLDLIRIQSGGAVLPQIWSWIKRALKTGVRSLSLWHDKWFSQVWPNNQEHCLGLTMPHSPVA